MVSVKTLIPSAETPLYFPSGSAQLFGVLHEPLRETGVPAFVFCHPFGEEKLWAHRVFVGFARELARRGHLVLRVDCRGNGDSDGGFSDSSLETNLEDLSTAVDWLKTRRHVNELALLGLRLGATEAVLLAERRRDISTLVLWSPVTDGARYMQELLRVNLSTQLATHGAISTDRVALVEQMQAGRTVNVDGYELAFPFYEQVSAVRLTGQRRSFARRCLIVQLERNAATAPARDLQELQRRLPSATLKVVQEEPFWKEIQRFYEATDQLAAVTLEWLESA